MNTFEWQNGTVVERPYIEINGTKYYIQDGTVSGGTPVSANNLNEMETILNNNITEAVENQYNLITDGNAVKTGRQIDNKDEYVVRVNCGNMPNATSKTVNLPINLANVKLTKQVQLFGQSANNEYPIMQSGITWYIGGNTLAITTTSDRSRFTCYVEIYFVYNS